MSVNQTLLRYLALQNNMLVNPFFEPIEHGSFGVRRYLPTPHQDCYRYAPGWFPLGWEGTGSITKRGLIPAGVNSQHEGSGSPTSAGVDISQDAGFKFGLVQQIWRGADSIPGRKVRIMGRYTVLSNPDGLTGIHIALKSKYERVDIGTSVVAAGASGGILNTNEVYHAPGIFQPTMVGNTLWIGATLGGVATGGTAGIYDISAYTNSTHVNVAGSDFPVQYVGGTYPIEVITGNNWVSTKAIRIGTTPRPLHVISYQSQTPGVDRFAGQEELLVRAWDYLKPIKTGPSGVISTTPSAILLSMGRESRAAGAGGVPSKTTGTSVYYLSDQYLDDGIADQTLVSQQVPTADTAVEHTFDVTIDVSALSTGGSLLNGLWLTVMPVDPTNIASMTGQARIALSALTLSIVPSDGSAQEVLDAQAPMLRAGGGPTAYSGFPAKFLQRYPIYVPSAFPLNVAVVGSGKPRDLSVTIPAVPSTPQASSVVSIVPSSTAAAIFTNSYSATAETPGKISIRSEGTLPGAYYGLTTLVARQDPLPPGAVILDSVFPMDYLFHNHASAFTMDLISITSVISTSSSPSEHTQAVVASWTYDLPAQGVVALSPSGAGQFASDKGFVDRNRLGTHWSSTGTSDFSAITPHQALAETWFRIHMPPVGSFFLDTRPGYIYAVVDPRTGNAMWKLES